MKYRHRWISGDRIDLPSGKVVCVGRNYAAHIQELNNPLPDDPVLFIKPGTSMINMDQPLLLPKNRGEVHHELEISLLIKETLKDASEKEATDAIMAIGLALDLTLRDLQNQQKSKGLPWEVAKAFDNSCPLSGFVAVEHVKDPANLEFSLKVNDELRQKGTTEHMLTSIPGLLSYISRHFTLMPGDIILTGTPAGVGPLVAGDELELSLHGTFTAQARCI
ncbi:fumarylacetoacetate hydrolase family protein [Endozoicomonas ascidiicola]|uniref:fumarylacetoacetate hydrolase family protein n=1 Tax=Endozoicomonas ascidiicola TaxID=1698521 RepID=UPI00082EEB37|nr:fumarylacetoacetate hydrolase family protein [Endozoicomonas ascidiicola]